MTAARSSADLATRRAILAEARAWIGTPYCHQASVRAAGADCLGLLRGVWRALYGSEPEMPPPYTPDWAEADAREDLLDAARRHLVTLAPEAASAGDVLVFRMREHGPAKHVGILSSPWLEPGRIIHAWSGGRVCETHLTPPWLRRIAGAFRFPAREG
jgi:NlpC/P60 family putative phage cell wall peptidase